MGEEIFMARFMTVFFSFLSTNSPLPLSWKERGEKEEKNL